MNKAEFNNSRKMTYNLMMNVGSCKYVITYYSGTRFNPDGSIAGDLHIESNKRRANQYISNLINQGYKGNGKF